MLKIISTCLIAGSLLTASPKISTDPLPPKTISELIAQYATLYKVSPITMTKVIKCESEGKSSAIGDGGHSYGLVQIHLPSHPEVTKEQALDPEFATQFLAKGIHNKQLHQWTCGRKLAKIKLT
jgi:hypothetical protein